MFCFFYYPKKLAFFKFSFFVHFDNDFKEISQTYVIIYFPTHDIHCVL